MFVACDKRAHPASWENVLVHYVKVPVARVQNPVHLDERLDFTDGRDWINRKYIFPPKQMEAISVNSSIRSRTFTLRIYELGWAEQWVEGGGGGGVISLKHGLFVEVFEGRFLWTGTEDSDLCVYRETTWVCLLKYLADYEKIAVVVFRFQYADKKPSLGEAKKYSRTIPAIAKYNKIYGCT
jgi:hypothetical protein